MKTHKVHYIITSKKNAGNSAVIFREGHPARVLEKARQRLVAENEVKSVRYTTADPGSSFFPGVKESIEISCRKPPVYKDSMKARVEKYVENTKNPTPAGAIRAAGKECKTANYAVKEANRRLKALGRPRMPRVKWGATPPELKGKPNTGQMELDVRDYPDTQEEELSPPQPQPKRTPDEFDRVLEAFRVLHGDVLTETHVGTLKALMGLAREAGG